MRPRVIGIAGPSCSGKSGLAASLAERFPERSPAVVRVDDYYRDLGALEPSLAAEHNFDHPSAVDRDRLIRHVEALSYGRSVEAPVYDFASHCRTDERRRVDPGQLVVVEGLFALSWPGLRELLAARVFLDAAHDVCLERRLKRDVAERGRDPAGVRRQYERTVRPMYDRFIRPLRARADLLLCGEDPVEHNAEVLERWLRAWPAPAGGSA